ncbi:diacylglycerol kinase 7 [Ziziphus jujuba]|uniref:Diacylglycerol kinase n=1 Tax=Ziziphus jujuba TaxID=326968 RepID=A0A6P3ZHI6_ZIZJJ|nr:diacylglycerol kinase 7 [Ziziphus jujuba]
MDSPSESTGEYSTRIATRSSMIESFRGCGLSGMRIDKVELRRRLQMPQLLRFAMRDSIRFKNPAAGETRLLERGNSLSAPAAADAEDEKPPESAMVVFINPRSGGRHGPMLKERLQQLISEEQVFDLSDVKPHEFVRYGLGCLEILAGHGNSCAKECREKMRVMVAGGDGTVGWVLGCLGELHKEGRLPVPPVGIIPLGTGNDLSRSFGWGGSFPFAWKSAIKRSLSRATEGAVGRLDSWHILLSMPTGEIVEPPHSLKHIEECALDEGLEVEGKLADKVSCYEGVFYNYFSIGMDAQVAYGFHHLRNEKPYLAQGPITNKLIYSGYTCTQGWFFTPCTSHPSLRGLKNILRMYVKKVNCSEWELIPVPSSVRAIVALNLHNYGSGRNPWGHLKPEYLEKRGFVEAHVDDGLLEIFGLKQGWHASFVMVELISAKHIAQAAAIRLEIRGGEWKNAYMQMDGEPWKQPMDEQFSTFVEIKRVPFQSFMIHGD